MMNLITLVVKQRWADSVLAVAAMDLASRKVIYAEPCHRFGVEEWLGLQVEIYAILPHAARKGDGGEDGLVHVGWMEVGRRFDDAQAFGATIQYEVNSRTTLDEALARHCGERYEDIANRLNERSTVPVTA